MDYKRDYAAYLEQKAAEKAAVENVDTNVETAANAMAGAEKYNKYAGNCF